MWEAPGGGEQAVRRDQLAAPTSYGGSEAANEHFVGSY